MSGPTCAAADTFGLTGCLFRTFGGLGAAELCRSASGERGSHPVSGLIRQSRFGNARCTGSGVQQPVVLAWYVGTLCGLPVVLGVVRKPGVRSAGCGQRGRMLGVVQIEARCAGCDPVQRVIPTERPLWKA